MKLQISEWVSDYMKYSNLQYRFYVENMPLPSWDLDLYTESIDL